MRDQAIGQIAPQRGFCREEERPADLQSPQGRSQNGDEELIKGSAEARGANAAREKLKSHGASLRGLSFRQGNLGAMALRLVLQKKANRIQVQTKDRSLTC
jgi:hypothetical protein